MPDKTIKLYLEIDGKQAHITLDSATLKTKELQTTIDKVSTKNLKGSFDSLIPSLKGVAGAMGLAFGATEVLEFLKSSVEEVTRSQRAIQQLNTVLYSTKDISGFTTQELEAMANSMEDFNKFKFDDHEIMEAQSKLLTFTNIHKDIFQEALQYSMDLSVRFEQELTPSIKQVGKALQDPIAGITALKKTGVQFSDQQKTQIKLFVEQNNLMAAQRIILDELRTEVSGASGAAVTEFDEKMGSMNKSVRELKKGIGTMLIPALKELVTEFQSVIKVMSFEGDDKGSEFFKDWLKLLTWVPRLVTVPTLDYTKNVIKKTLQDDVVLNPKDNKDASKPLSDTTQNLRQERNELDGIVNKTLKANQSFDYQKKTVGEIKAHIEELNKLLDTYVKGSKEYNATKAERDKLQAYIKDDKHLVDQRAVLAAELLEKSQTGLDKELAALDKYYVEKMRIAKGNAALELALHNYVEKEKLLKIEDSEIEIRNLIREMEGYSKEFHNPIETDMFGHKHADFGTPGDATPEEERQRDWTPYDYAQNEYDSKPYAERLKDEQEVWNATHKTILAGVDTIQAGVNTMWSEFIVGSRQAKDAWDAIWLSMRNTALDALRDVVQEWMKSGIRSLFDSPTDKAQASGSSSDGGSIVGDFITAIGSIFGLADGGIVNHPMIAKIGEVGPEMVMPLRNVKTFFGNNSNTKNIESIMDRKLNQFVEAVGNIDTLLTGENIHFAGDRAKKRIKSNNL